MVSDHGLGSGVGVDPETVTKVFLESPFPLCPLKVFMCFKSKPEEKKRTLQ